MKVGVDARKAGDYGIGTYIRSLLSAMVPLAEGTEWVLFHRPGERGLLPEGEHVLPLEVSAGTYTLRELLLFAPLARTHGLDLFHSPHYTLPYRLPCPSVVTIHDLIHLLFPDYARRPLAQRYARYMIGRARREASRIVTVSHSSARDLERLFPGQGGEGITVIPNGVDPLFSPRPLEEARAWLSSSLDVRGAFLLFVGNPKRHKNLDQLLRAFSRLLDRYPGLEVVVVGGTEEQRRSITLRARELGADGALRLFGTVDSETLALLYSAATIFVFPSLYEGFGLPPLEAMASGAPVAASNTSSIPEVLGPAAAYFDPRSDDSLLEVLCGLLDDAPRRERMRRDGLARARTFSWGESARRTLEVYRLAAGGGNP